MIYIGIDPGLDGALAVLAPDGCDLPPVWIVDTPTVAVKKSNGRIKRDYDLAAIRDLLYRIVAPLSFPNPEAFAVIEQVHAMPGQGVTSMFAMGYGLGWEWALAVLRIPYQRVAPQRWQRVMLAGAGRGKDAARLQAMRLFPSVADQLRRKSDHGRADALLLAEYGRRTANRR